MVFEVIDIEQGTPEWLALRMKYITASQVPVLMGVSPYQSPGKLLIEKLTGQEEDKSDKLELFQRGHDLEATARRIIKEYHFKPAVLISKKIPSLMASLDGMDFNHNIILEAKYVGKAKLTAIKGGNIPKSHMLQMQAQLMVSGAVQCLYFATDGDRYARIIVKPDEVIFKKIEEEVSLFLKTLEEYRNGREQIDDGVFESVCESTGEITTSKKGFNKSTLQE